MSGGAAEYASAAAQAVRLVAHALTPAELDSPQEVDRVLSELALLGQRLPAAVDKLCQAMLRLHNAAEIGHDAALTGAELDAEVDEAAETLSTAVRTAYVLAAALDQAREITAHFTGGAR